MTGVLARLRQFVTDSADSSSLIGSQTSAFPAEFIQLGVAGKLIRTPGELSLGFGILLLIQKQEPQGSSRWFGHGIAINGQFQQRSAFFISTQLVDVSVNIHQQSNVPFMASVGRLIILADRLLNDIHSGEGQGHHVRFSSGFLTGEQHFGKFIRRRSELCQD